MLKHSDNQIPLEKRLARLAAIANVIPSLLLLLVLWYFQASLYLVAVVAVLLCFLSLYSITAIRRTAQFHFQSIHNLLDAVVRGDYSFRGAGARNDSAFGELVGTINALASTVQRQRLLSQESQHLVQKVVDQIDVAIIAWDEEDVIQLINPAARNLLVDVAGDGRGQPMPEELAFVSELKVRQTQVRDLGFGGSQGRYRLHLEQFISEGHAHNLLFMTNLSSILRLEERRAWRNLVRVLSHEINNSLAPLKSFSNTLMTQIEKRESDPSLKQELLEGMQVIGRRADSLATFVQSYQKIARLPEPNKRELDIKPLIVQLSSLFRENSLKLKGDSVTVAVDSGQIEQALINLIKNAAEASEEGAEILVSWFRDERYLVLTIEDHGEGIQNSENLFTPYYTTKPSGSGIGLVFCQQVVEAHGGYLQVGNRKAAGGCEARMGLPL